MRDKTLPTLRSFDMFAGVGGFRLGADRAFKNSGIRHVTVGRCEIDRFCNTTYKANFDVTAEVGISDITEITGINDVSPTYSRTPRQALRRIDSELPDFDILFAGFPCQPFSTMGNRGGTQDPRGTLFFHIARILAAKRPEFFMLENVRGILTVDGGRTFTSLIEILRKDLGYQVDWWLLNSADFGVPQTRRRVFIVGQQAEGRSLSLRAPVPWRPERFQAERVRSLLAPETPERYWLSERLIKTIMLDGTGGFHYKSEIDRDIARPLCRTMHKMHRAHQDNYYSERYISAVKRGDLGRIRRLTPREAFLLQGFPEGFADRAQSHGVSDTQLYMQAGNAVTVTVVQAILESVFQLEVAGSGAERN